MLILDSGFLCWVDSLPFPVSKFLDLPCIVLLSKRSSQQNAVIENRLLQMVLQRKRCSLCSEWLHAALESVSKMSPWLYSRTSMKTGLVKYRDFLSAFNRNISFSPASSDTQERTGLPMALARWAGWSAGQVGRHVKCWSRSNDLAH